MKRMLFAASIAALCLIETSRAAIEAGQGFIDVPGGPVWYEIAGDGAGLAHRPIHRGIARRSNGTGPRTRAPARPFLGRRAGSGLRPRKSTDGIASVVLSSPLLSTPDWIEDAAYLRRQLPASVQDTLTKHEEAGTTDSAEYRAASDVFYERHVYGGDRTEPPDECAGAPGNDFIYEYMWGPTEFRATGNLVDFDVTDRLRDIDVPVLFIAGQFDEARPERIAEFHNRVPDSEFVIILGAAHLTLSKKPDEYMAVIENFFDSVEKRLEQP